MKAEEERVREVLEMISSPLEGRETIVWERTKKWGWYFTLGTVAQVIESYSHLELLTFTEHFHL